ncbi:hypothetical protein ScPMuIL_000763 [Solemya velum]
MTVNVPGIIGIVIFYLLVLAVGIWAGRKSIKSTNTDELFLANRNLGMILSSLTIAATGIGAAYINGTAEEMAREGFLWVQAPFGYMTGIAIAAIVYARKLRRMGYVTIFDPIQEKVGSRMGGLLFFPELLGELFWEAAILVALGTSLSVILDMDSTIAIIISACVAVVYTFFGGLYSVAYTDVIQLGCIVLGLVLSIPFAWANDAVDVSRIRDDWVGHIPANKVGVYIDTYCMLIGGGIPWQSYYQRALACQTPSIAMWSSLIGVVITVLMAIPPTIVGVIGASTDWNATSYDGEIPIPPEKLVFILPMVLQYLCPLAVSVIGIGAVSAAGMSSTDSIILATGSVFSKNIYKNIFRPQATEREIIWVLRISILVCGIIGTVIAITVNSVYGLFTLCADLMYVILFPQLTCVLWVNFANTYGSLSGFLLGLSLRVLGGEKLLKLPPVIKFPFFDEQLGQLFPFKSFAMICSYIGIIGVSFVTDRMFRNGYVPQKYDIFGCIERSKTKKRNTPNDTKTEDNEKTMPLDVYNDADH